MGALSAAVPAQWVHVTSVKVGERELMPAPFVLPLWREDRATFAQLLGEGVKLGASGLVGWPLDKVDRYTLELLPRFRLVTPGQLPGWTINGETDPR